MEGFVGTGGHVQFLGGAEIERALASSLDPDRLYAMLRPYIDQGMSVIEGEIQQRTPQGASNELKNAVVHNVMLKPDGLYGSVFIQPESKAADYAVFVELGRAPGKMPPVDNLIPWATVHLTNAYKALRDIHTARGDTKGAKALSKFTRKTDARDAAVNSFAWALAKHIAKYGTPAQHFFDRGWTAGFPQAERIITFGISECLERMQSAD